jgi:predicted CoA-substrate-specific enzyme activase
MKFIGVDIGKISFKAVVVNLKKEVKEIFWKAHNGEIEETWKELKEDWQIEDKDKVLVTGRFRDMLPYPSVPERVAQEKAVSYLYPENGVTLIRLGGGGFSVLKTRKGKQSEFRQNPRCAAGTGSFLTQILGRLGLDIFQADQMVKNVKGLEITSRCGVTMKTDFTHLLNQGNQVADVLAGLLDSSAKNAVALALKSRVSPKTLVIGGLSVSQRIVQTIRENLNVTQIEVPSQALYFEALGAALTGLEKNLPKITNKPLASPLVFLQSLQNSVKQVIKIDFPKNQECSENLVLGLDIGSTGSKLVLVAKSPIFETYTETKGQPVQAAKNLILKVPSEFLSKIKAAGITGSGREIVSSLLQSSLPEEKRQQVFVLNEIAAHARGAIYYDSAVDTVVDIGGQDAKFTRLENGRVTDSCMNTVCSAGTGSFLAEQLQLLGLKDIGQLGKRALESPRAVDLGQHCAVFIAEQIDETKRKGAKLEEIAAGLYYSIIKNYNNRVKGLREYGHKIFLQGKPAENLALACALAKVTGQQIVIPPSPGSMGALGIALLAKEECEGKVWESSPINLEKFLKSEVLNIQESICQAKDGCRDGNQCRIKVMTVEQEDLKFKFLSGGACDKYEKIGKSKAIAEAPRPFLEREKLITSFILGDSNQLTKKTIGIPRGLETEEILPMIVVFFQELGFTVKVLENYGLKSLVEGAKLCQATFCSPVQILAGEAERLKEENFIFLPKITEIPGKKEEKRCWVCPLSQATPDLFSPKLPPKVLQPFLDLKGGYERNQKEFIRLGSKLGCSRGKTLAAFKKAVNAQNKFEKQCRQIGNTALAYAIEKEIPVVVVLGHPYIINSPLLSAGIAETIQEKAAIAIPADCYPLEDKSPVLDNIYWGYGHRLLNVAFEARRRSGVYPLWLSVYSCGPDSFLIHFFQYLSQGKPYTILESDAYTGQAGFKTRVEVFLYSIKNYYPKQEKNLPDLSHF